MKKPAVNYRNLRFRDLRTPEYSHLLLLLGWVVYFFLYLLTERLIPPQRCHLIHCTLDDRIPFCEWFAVFYVLWYVLIVFSLAYFLLYHVKYFRQLQTYIMILQLLATVVFVLYPSRQELRPETFPRQNLLTAVMGLIYRLDTPTGVFPSLHAAISIGIASVWLRQKSEPLWARVGVAWFCAMVCLSVCFVKQHSVLDVLAAIPVCLAAEWVVYCRKANEFFRLQSHSTRAKIPPKGGEFL